MNYCNKNIVRDKSVVLVFELTICALAMLRKLPSKGLTAIDI